MKECKKCKTSKPKSFFYKSPGMKDGILNSCKSCVAEQQRVYEESENAKSLRKKRCKTDRYIQRKKAYSHEYNKKYWAENKERLSENNKIYTKSEKYKAYRKSAKHRVCIRKTWNERYKSDTAFRLSIVLRRRLGTALKHVYRSGSAVRDLGCSITFLKHYLENRFEDGMTWENHGVNGWHIDHVEPISKFDLSDREQLLRACNYTNLQPMWAKDNLSKGCKL